MNKWEYGEVYKKYNMEGEIKIGTGILKVHDIFDKLPNFMKDADCLFCDPPCSLININSFYTKAERTDYQTSFDPFKERFFDCVDKINPNNLFLEVFKSNKESFLKKVKERYPYVQIYENTYYHNKKNKCWIIQGTRKEKDLIDLNGIDEETAIEKVCKEVDYKCIGDLCMGRGLVGYNAFKNNKRFVGTEINKKRLAVLVDNITNYKGKECQNE